MIANKLLLIILLNILFVPNTVSERTPLILTEAEQEIIYQYNKDSKKPLLEYIIIEISDKDISADDFNHVYRIIDEYIKFSDLIELEQIIANNVDNLLTQNDIDYSEYRIMAGLSLSMLGKIGSEYSINYLKRKIKPLDQWQLSEDEIKKIKDEIITYTRLRSFLSLMHSNLKIEEIENLLNELPQDDVYNILVKRVENHKRYLKGEYPESIH